ncbi:hypothetical protein CDD82_1813 [Ophiocordyceps australis]|uniref:Uncharacterized protein n=1 Tax=Ophiocordyceps australis TaxID=1399860 RepID=A0A2C5ZM00_9HYPO|nr:hypothetical protein CDD82_1813 [Ophiocordyceps australis]
MSASAMNREEYSDVKLACHGVLKKHYYRVATPPEGPGKSSFDQVLFIVYDGACPVLTYQEMKDPLGAVSMRKRKPYQFCQFTIPWATIEAMRDAHRGSESSGEAASDNDAMSVTYADEPQGDGPTPGQDGVDGNAPAPAPGLNGDSTHLTSPANDSNRTPPRMSGALPDEEGLSPRALQYRAREFRAMTNQIDFHISDSVSFQAPESNLRSTLQASEASNTNGVWPQTNSHAPQTNGHSLHEAMPYASISDTNNNGLSGFGPVPYTATQDWIPDYFGPMPYAGTQNWIPNYSGTVTDMPQINDYSLHETMPYASISDTTNNGLYSFGPVPDAGTQNWMPGFSATVTDASQTNGHSLHEAMPYENLSATNNDGFSTTSNDDSSATNNDVFSATNNDGVSATSNDDFSTTSNDDFSATNKDDSSATNNEDSSATKNNGLPRFEPVPNPGTQSWIPGYRGVITDEEFGILKAQVEYGRQMSVGTEGLFNNLHDELQAWERFGLEGECLEYREGELPQELTAMDGELIQYTNEPEGKHVKIEVLICRTLEDFWWSVFLCLHGDMMAILRTMIMPYGLNVSFKGLFLRVPGFEFMDHGDTVFLTRDPFRAIKFLGFPEEDEENIWTRRFRSMFALYCRLTQCSVFWTEAYYHCEQRLANMVDRQNLLSLAERKKWERPSYQEWLQRFVPLCRVKGWYTRPRETRESMTAKAIEFFGVGNAFKEMRGKLRTVESARLVRGLISDLVTTELDQYMEIRQMMEETILNFNFKHGIYLPNTVFPVEGVYDGPRVEEFIRSTLPVFVALVERGR